MKVTVEGVLQTLFVVLIVVLLTILGLSCSKQSVTVVPSTERKQGVPDLGDMAYALDGDDLN